MASQDERQYEIIVFGATGYSGKYTAEHIVTSLPTDLRWAVAGRSEGKLRVLVDELTLINAERVRPGIEIANVAKNELVALAKMTKVLVSEIWDCGSRAETGTHYLDITGETPWVYDMVQKYHETAKKNGAIMIPQIGVDFAPADLLAWSLVSHIRHTLGTGTTDLIFSTYELKMAPSGGTLATVFSVYEFYSLADLAKKSNPNSLFAIKRPGTGYKKSLLEKLLGLRSVSDLGMLTTSFQAPSDSAIVNRSWSLFDGGKYYGPKFQYMQYIRARNALIGAGIHLFISWLLKKVVFQPGQGPTKEDVKNDRAEWWAIATADSVDPNDPKRAFGRVAWEGSLYHLTGVFLAEAAIVIARGKTLAHEIGGGILTPATLGAPFVERMQKVGLTLEVRTMP